jgi:ceramide glucosyltransferase
VEVRVGSILFAVAALGLIASILQLVLLRLHLRSASRKPCPMPPISILKPLCGVDDDLEANLASFASLDYPSYEVILGVRDRSDPAWRVADDAVRRWRGRFRLVIQRGEPGLNPKVNQLIGLAAVAHHDVLLVSDSNVRAPDGYLDDVAYHLAEPGVGLVTHPVGGVGEESLGSTLDNLQASSAVGPATVAVKRLTGRDVVVGKSMALRRADLAAMGGFESVRDVLAEDYVLGVKVTRELGKRVAIGSVAIPAVSERRDVAGFLSRYGRWCVMQRKIAGTPVYAAQALLYPLPFALAGLAFAPGTWAVPAALLVWLSKSLLDGTTARILRGTGFGARVLWLSPLKDFLFLFAFVRAFGENSVEWRGNRLLVQAGSRLRRVSDPSADGVLALER